MKTFRTNLVLDVKSDESAWQNFSESMTYDTFSVIQAAKAVGDEDLMAFVNMKLAQRATTAATEVPIKEGNAK